MIALCAIWTGAAQAQGGADGTSGLSTPRFVSLVANKVNMRAGPGVSYPVSWVYARAGLPMMVTLEFEHWRKVRASDGTEGWIHKSLLSGHRTAVVLGDVHDFRYEPLLASAVAFRAEGGVVGDLEACDGNWCRMKVAGRTGWIERANIYGALPDENFD